METIESKNGQPLSSHSNFLARMKTSSVVLSLSSQDERDFGNLLDRSSGGSIGDQSPPASLEILELRSACCQENSRRLHCMVSTILSSCQPCLRLEATP
jgi:hypothetical protein